MPLPRPPRPHSTLSLNAVLLAFQQSRISSMNAALHYFLYIQNVSSVIETKRPGPPDRDDGYWEQLYLLYKSSIYNIFLIYFCLLGAYI